MEETITGDRRSVKTVALLIGICLMAVGIFQAGHYFGMKEAAETDLKYIQAMCYCSNRTSYVPNYELQVNLSFLEEILEKEK